jgi:hypothetical protein
MPGPPKLTLKAKVFTGQDVQPKGKGPKVDKTKIIPAIDYLNDRPEDDKEDPKQPEVRG